MCRVRTIHREAYCSVCNEDRHFQRQTKRQTLTVRGKDITADVSVLVCEVCGNDRFDPDRDEMAVYYQAYREQEGLLTPEDVRRIREQYGLSREAFASLLGMSPASLYRYENGALQDNVHDELLRVCDDPHHMADLVRRHRDRLSELQYQRFCQALSQQSMSRHQPPHSPRCSAEEDEYVGGRVFSYERFGLLVHRLCHLGGSAFTTKLNKLLFFADFLACRELGRSITGSPYRAIQFGPVPRDYDVLLQRLEEDGYVIREEVDFTNGSGTRVRAGDRLPEPDEALTPDEEAIVQQVTNAFHHRSTAQTRDHSHRQQAYIQTTRFQLVSYRHASTLQLPTTDASSPGSVDA